jgi:hypothetical protein
MMLVHTLKTLMLMAVTAPPFFMLLTGCTFGAPGEAASSGIFCNIERGRQCATTEDIAMGIDIARQDEQGFFVGGTSTYGLDYSPAATAQCSGMPQKVLFQGQFPEGTQFCVKPSSIGGSGTYPTVTAACQAKCDAEKLIDNDGNPYHCSDVAWPAHRADMVFDGACTSTGTPSTSFQDPRKLPPMKPVAWTNLVNVSATGNSLKKTSATPAYDAGAAATRLLDVTVNGAFEFTATETNTERTAGLATGPLPDNDPSDADIAYAVVLRNDGTFSVTEFQQPKFTGSYAAGDRIRVQVLGGIVSYYKNGAFQFAGSTATAPALRVSVSLKDPGATITNAQTTF